MAEKDRLSSRDDGGQGRVWAWTIAALLAVSAWGAEDAPSREPGPVIAQGIRLRDSDGRIRAELGLTPGDEPFLMMNDEEGVKRAVLCIDEGGPVLFIKSSDELSAVGFWSKEDTGVGVGMAPPGDGYCARAVGKNVIQECYQSSAASRRVLNLLDGIDSAKSVILKPDRNIASYDWARGRVATQTRFSVDGLSRIQLGDGGKGSYWLSLRSGIAGASAAFGVSSNGTPFLFIKDSKHRERIIAQVLQPGWPGIDLYNDRGKIRLSFGIRSHGHRGLVICDQESYPAVMFYLNMLGMPALQIIDQKERPDALDRHQEKLGQP